ncbi:MAG: hypothetical protein EHM35_08540 [Planctomycetaceae bacterium]|nr:MAG: hypothetical protein EHM35_08540 [Planctomycetaceae bacterium]
MDHTRHAGIFDASRWPVTLIGAGGIGALTAITLAKMGVPYLKIYDPDAVSGVNIATQFYRHFDVERAKVDALRETVGQFADDVSVDVAASSIACFESSPEDITNPIIISAVDSIHARQEIWEVVRCAPFRWYLDARMGAEVFQLYAVSGSETGWYDRLMLVQDDRNVPDEPCTAKATIYTACIAAGQIGLVLREIVTGSTPPKFMVHDIRSRSIVVP